MASANSTTAAKELKKEVYDFSVGLFLITNFSFMQVLGTQQPVWEEVKGTEKLTDKQIFQMITGLSPGDVTGGFSPFTKTLAQAAEKALKSLRNKKNDTYMITVWHGKTTYQDEKFDDTLGLTSTKVALRKDPGSHNPGWDMDVFGLQCKRIKFCFNSSFLDKPESDPVNQQWREWVNEVKYDNIDKATLSHDFTLRNGQQQNEFS